MWKAQGSGRWAAVTVAAILMMLAAAIASPAQTFSSLSSLNSVCGVSPDAGLVQATDSNFYGTAYFGGYYGTCVNSGFRPVPVEPCVIRRQVRQNRPPQFQNVGRALLLVQGLAVRSD